MRGDVAKVRSVEVRSILTRTTGFLRTISSHSLQPYRGCTFGGSLCGVGCYVRSNVWVTRGEPWGSFLEARVNAAQVYLRQMERERAWARRHRGELGVFMSSSTDPFLPQERRFGVTRSVLEAMCEAPPDSLILQTHSPSVAEDVEVYAELARRTRLRIHVSIETDRERLLGLPPPASSPDARFEAAEKLRSLGYFVVITVAPLLPLRDPEAFFRRAGECADAVVIDHFIEGDGTPDGRRTRRTALPAAMEEIEPGSVSLDYRERIVEIARRILPGRVGVSIEGFAGRFS